MAKKSEKVYWGQFTNDNRTFYMAATEKGLVHVNVNQTEDFQEAFLEEVNKRVGGAELVHDAERLELPIRQLQEYLSGSRQVFDLEMDLRGTEFQRAVWQALLQIPYGKTCSYLDIARAIGKEKAVRAVGGAVGHNPLLMIIPCHRVIGKSGTLTGFSSGLDFKVKLLALEGIGVVERNKEKLADWAVSGV